MHSSAVLRATRFIRVDFPHTPSASARPTATTYARHASGLRRYVITSLSFEVCSLCFPFFRYHALARAKLAPTRPSGRPEAACATTHLSTSRGTHRSSNDVFRNGSPARSRVHPPEGLLQPAIGNHHSHFLTGIESDATTRFTTPTLRTHRTLPGPTRRFCHRQTAHNPSQPQSRTQTVGSQPITQALAMS